ncbi:MAG: hypothetical protein HOW71_29025, partial [Nonomuraea sp.]|nr:hypothetical protein [Nonomuraea sp.]
EVAVKVRALFEKYELEYVTGPLPKQVFSAWRKVVRLSLPNKTQKTNKTHKTNDKPMVETPVREQELVGA